MTNTSANNKPTVFIRGIYSTALTKIFMDAGYPIIFPSKAIRNRFKLPLRPENTYSKDITIKDRLDRQGISILFKKKVWDELEENNFKEFPLNQQNFPNLIHYQARFHKNSIYRGLIVNSDQQQNYSHIRLIPEDSTTKTSEHQREFQTTLARYARYIPDSKEGIFQVTHEDNGRNRASLGSYYTVPGDLVVIVPYNDRIIISKEIFNGRVKKHLFDLGKDIQGSKKYGFIFRTAAELANDDEILEEADRLEQDLIEIQNTITKFPDKIGEIYANYRSLNIIFPKQVKMQFDEMRQKRIPTLANHHTIKSMVGLRYEPRQRGGYRGERKTFSFEKMGNFYIEDLVNYTEEIMVGLDKNARRIISGRFMKKYFAEFLKPRLRMNILHQKLTGKRLMLTSGNIQSYNFGKDTPSSVKLKRWMTPGGLYDGLKTPIEEGDYAITTFREDDWYYVSTYFSRNNEIKGKYYNINTPIEISSYGIHYLDLEIDVIENMVGERTIVDKELLDQALEMGIISEEVHSKALGLAENILEGRI
ncbi:MAG: DUF402 domain-containing protein [Promethearchaeota archaeon]